MADQPQIRTQEQRPRRIPFGVPNTKLGITMSLPGYHLHWVNDTAGRIDEAKLGGYEFVSPSEVNDTSKESHIKRLVGKREDGSGMYAYLMKIRQDWYDEDQRALQSQVDKFDRAIRRGDLEKAPNDNRYNAGISITS